MTDLSYFQPDPPEPEVSTLDDGCVEIRVGSLSGVVSSHHLIEPKLRQLRTAWCKRFVDGCAQQFSES